MPTSYVGKGVDLKDPEEIVKIFKESLADAINWYDNLMECYINDTRAGSGEYMPTEITTEQLRMALNMFEERMIFSHDTKSKLSLRHR